MARTMNARISRHSRITSHHLRKNVGSVAEPAHFIHDPVTGAYQGHRNAPVSQTAFYQRCTMSEEDQMEAALNDIFALKMACHGDNLTTVHHVPIVKGHLL